MCVERENVRGAGGWKINGLFVMLGKQWRKLYASECEVFFVVVFYIPCVATVVFIGDVLNEPL